MKLKNIDVVASITPHDFQKNYYKPQKPLIIRHLAKEWEAFSKWDWSYLIQELGEHRVGVYNNIKSDAYTPINTADDYMLFGDYLKRLQKGPLNLRIFLFNLFQHAPHLVNDVQWPDHLCKGFVKSYPMLFVGGEGSVTHMHFDIDTSHIFHTQFIGRKKVLLFPFEEQYKLYRKPWEVLCQPDFTDYETAFDYQKYPATRQAEGYEVILEHGDTLFMPAGYWHHMSYLESGFAVSLRALQKSPAGKLLGLWRLFGMRNIDTLMKKTLPVWWHDRKLKQLYKKAEAYL